MVDLEIKARQGKAQRRSTIVVSEECTSAAETAIEARPRVTVRAAARKPY